jgi:TonB family protein
VTSAVFTDLVAYSCGLSLMAFGAWLATASAPAHSPRLLLTYFQVTLVAATTWPLWSLITRARPIGGGVLPILVSADASASTWSPAGSVGSVIVAVVTGGIVLRFAWLAFGCLRLRVWRRDAIRLEPVPESIAEIERALGVRARWFVTAQLASAATYGFWRPVVLLPARERLDSPSTLNLVAWHELLHIRRRDWLVVLAEECLHAVLWFQPAVWFLIDRIRLYREQVIDEGVVSATGAAKDYARALLDGTGVDWAMAPRPASQWSRARHLRSRIRAIVNGGRMSTAMRVKRSGVFATALIVSAYSAWYAFPLQGSGAQSDRHVYSTKDPGVTLPKIVREVRPQYTQEAMDAHIEGSVQLALTIEADGSVSDVQITESLDPTFGLDDQAVKAAWQWLFSPATKDGHPVAVGVDLQLKFTLK